MFPSLETKYQRFLELELKLQDPEILSNQTKMLAIQKEYGGLQKVAAVMKGYHSLLDDIEAAEMMIEEEKDPKSREYFEVELEGLNTKMEAMKTSLEDMATAGDSITRGGLIMEIRAGTGGEEAALFARDLLEMYSKYIDMQGWKKELLDLSPADMGGIKEVVLSVTGDGAYHRLQFESGGHRVQRVPETETQGRIHTSAATVAVLPEAEDVEIEIKEEDLQIDTYRASGPGGQKVNKTESAIRITHIPTGTVVTCQDEKSQHKNRAKAMKVLKSRILEVKTRESEQARSAQRRTLIGTGDRSERIRTYNFPQSRITDHRIGLTVYKLDQVMLGNLDELINGLLEFDRQERLKGDFAAN
jgi:peptide chain release factor 1